MFPTFSHFFSQCLSYVKTFFVLQIKNKCILTQGCADPHTPEAGGAKNTTLLDHCRGIGTRSCGQKIPVLDRGGKKNDPSLSSETYLGLFAPLLPIPAPVNCLRPRAFYYLDTGGNDMKPEYRKRPRDENYSSLQFASVMEVLQKQYGPVNRGKRRKSISFKVRSC